MPFLIVPNEVYGNDATVWVAAIDETLDPVTTILEYGSNQKSLNSGWIDFETADRTRRLRYQRVTLNNLSPRTKYSLALRVGGVVRADGSMNTIPHHLPFANERPFTVLLGSCYYGQNKLNLKTNNIRRLTPCHKHQNAIIPWSLSAPVLAGQ